MIRKLIWYVYGLCALTARMVVVVAGCIALTAFVTDWWELDWRFRVVCGLFFAAYFFAASIEFLAEKMVKTETDRGQS